jgi:formate dehydrogenase major subunit
VRWAPSFRIVEYDTPRGSAAAYYPETNQLVPPDATAISNNQPAFKSIIVALAPEGHGPSHQAGGQDHPGSDWPHKSQPEPTHLS